MRSEILSIGTELLLGHITDTNASWLAQQLIPLGIDLFYVSEIGDNLERLTATISRAHERSDLVVMTGGLGPTEDDLSREAIAAVLHEIPRVDPEIEKNLRAFFAGRGIIMPERNVKQAWTLPSVTILPNPIGTAPGWWAEHDGKVIIAMPGVPYEMKRMWQSEIVPRLRQRTNDLLFTRILRVAGMGESSVEERLTSVIHSDNPTVATYAKPDAVDVRVTAKAPTSEQAQALVATVEERIRATLGRYIFGIDDDTPQSVIVRMLMERRLILATMESCTGGLLSSLITDVPGSSNAFRGGLISYATELKETWGVPAEIIADHGVVSIETARAMAAAARQQTGADIGVGVTGVAGPDEQEGKPVGEVHISVVAPYGTRDTTQHFRGPRSEIKLRAAYTALNLLRLHLIHSEGQN
jgi:competence/damage-inducible protein CinA-like protein